MKTIKIISAAAIAASLFAAPAMAQGKAPFAVKKMERAAPQKMKRAAIKVGDTKPTFMIVDGKKLPVGEVAQTKMLDEQAIKLSACSVNIMLGSTTPIDDMPGRYADEQSDVSASYIDRRTANGYINGHPDLYNGEHVLGAGFYVMQNDLCTMYTDPIGFPYHISDQRTCNLVTYGNNNGFTHAVLTHTGCYAKNSTAVGVRYFE